MKGQKSKNKALQPLNAPLYTYWQALIFSFFSANLYVDVGKRWRGFGLLYLIFISLLLTLPFSLRMSLEFDTFFKEQIIFPLKHIPSFSIQKGLVSFDKPMPYFIKNKNNRVVGLIDTTGSITSMEQYPGLNILITKDKFFYQMPRITFFFAKKSTQPDNPIHIERFNPKIDQVFDVEQWMSRSNINSIKWVYEVMMYPMMALFFFFTLFILSIALALMGKFIAKLFFKFALTFKQAFRLFFVALTPTVVLLMACLTINWIFWGLNGLLFIMLCSYFCFAVNALKQASKTLVVS